MKMQNIILLGLFVVHWKYIANRHLIERWLNDQAIAERVDWLLGMVRDGIDDFNRNPYSKATDSGQNCQLEHKPELLDNSLL